MINFLKVNIKDKHDFIMLKKDDGKWFSKINKAGPLVRNERSDLSVVRSMTDDRFTCINRTLSPLNLKPINS